MHKQNPCIASQRASAAFLNWLDRHAPVIRNNVKEADISVTLTGGVILRFHELKTSQEVYVIFEDGTMAVKRFKAVNLIFENPTEDNYQQALTAIIDIYSLLNKDGLPY
jgi:hypothetical protein